LIRGKRSLIARSRRIKRIFGESDGDRRDVTNRLEAIKAFFQRLPDVNDIRRFEENQ